MRSRTRKFLGVLLAAVPLALGACGDGGQPATSPGGANSGSPAVSYPVTVGGVTLTERPEKIISLAPVATETLFAIGAGPQVDAVDDQSNYPPEAPRTELSGFTPNAEAIAARDPDLVIISNDINKITEQLTKLRIPVFLAAAAQTLEDTYQQITDLGTLTGHPGEAAALNQRMRDEIGKLVGDLPQRTEKLTYYYELDPTLYTVTSKTFVGSLFSTLGLANIADPADADGKAAGYPQLSAEFLINANPDFIFLADTKCCQQDATTVAARSGWSGLTAVRNNQVIALDDDIASRWGPRVVDLVRAVVDAVAKVPA